MPPPAFTEIAAGFSFLESPRWHDGRLWLSDFYTHRVLRLDAAGRAQTVCEVPAQPSGLGWLPDGRLLVCAMRERRVLRLEPDGRLVEHADLSAIAGGHINDMVVDGQGRAWVGNFGFDRSGDAPLTPARLACVEPDGTARVAAEGLYFPNGSVLTPDGRTLIVAETMGNRISAFDIAAEGTLGPRRDWAVFGAVPADLRMPAVREAMVVAPDGMALDAEGAVWLADARHRRVLRVAEGGRILQAMSTGELGAYACMLGGPARRTLYVCVAPDGVPGQARSLTGAALWATEVEVPGAGWPC